MPNRTRPAASAIGWYVHVPFCDGKCGYCDFYSVPFEVPAAEAYRAAVCREIAERDPRRPVATVYVGGGTPTILPRESLRPILTTIVSRAGRAAEFTIEANPGTTDPRLLELLLESGANRLSLGIQTMHDPELQLLGRRHTARDTVEAVAAARAAGFQNLSVDLIYGLPGQQIAQWADTLHRTIDLQADHVSCYGLTYEPETVFAQRLRSGELARIDESLEADMFQLAIEQLTAAGYEHYEISNFARPGRRCRANLIYWHNQEYFGVGPSAVSYLDGTRRKNVADLRAYLAGMTAVPQVIAVEHEHLGPLASAGETAIQMLRLIEGIDVEAFSRQTGLNPHALFSLPIDRFTRLGLLESTTRTIRLTRAGLLVANRIMQEFLLDDEATGSEGQAGSDRPDSEAGSSGD